MNGAQEIIPAQAGILVFTRGWLYLIRIAAPWVIALCGVTFHAKQIATFQYVATNHCIPAIAGMTDQDSYSPFQQNPDTGNDRENSPSLAY